jgi:hypothetical protein
LDVCESLLKRSKLYLRHPQVYTNEQIINADIYPEWLIKKQLHIFRF